MAPSQPSPGLLSSPRMEIWPDFIQPKVTPAPLPYRTLLISDQQGSGWKERLTAFISQSSVVVCSLQPFTYKEFPAGEGRYLLTACSGKQRSPATRSGSAAKDKWPCPEGINKPKITEHSTYPSSFLKIDQATLLEGKRRDQRRARLVPWDKCTQIHTSSG